jgi:cyanophycin synthetase
MCPLQSLWKILQPDLTRRPRLLELLSLLDRAAGFLRRRQAAVRRAEHNLAVFYDQVWREAAAALGASVEPLGQGVLEIRLGDTMTRLNQNATAIDDLATFRVVRTKPVIYRLLEKHGIPTPRHVTFSMDDMGPAVAFLEGSDGDCVVKPASGTGGGLGVATGIRTRWQLARAAFAAGAHGDDVLIEEQLEGDNYRLLYLDGVLIDAVLRRPPTVIGDGRSSLRRLVAQANAERAQRGRQLSHGLLSIDLDMKRTLARQGYSFRSVPRAGTVVTLKTAINENGGADNITATDLLCPEVIAEGARAARITGVRLAGVDVLTRDPTVPLHEAGGVILEVNSPPGYFWHYHKRDGSFALAVPVLRCLLGLPAASESCGPSPPEAALQGVE